MISEELEELFEISDRIAVLAAGRLSPAEAKAATNAESVGLRMSGLFTPPTEASAPASASSSSTESSHASA